MNHRRSHFGAALRPLRLAVAAVLMLTVACSDDSPTDPGQDERDFIHGTEEDPQIGLAVASLGRSLHLFQIGNPLEQRVLPLGASSSVTPVAIEVDGNRVLVPLGNAASVALIDPSVPTVDRYFLFASGNTSGAAFVDANTALATNLVADQVGRLALNEPGSTIQQLVDVAPAPTDIVIAEGRAFVVSGNLDENFAPLGNGVVTVLDPQSLQVLGTIDTGDTNPQYGALAPNGNIYVVNTGDYFSPATMAVIDPGTMERVGLVEGLSAGPGAITIDSEGLAYISGFFFGTLVYDTNTGAFVRGADDPVCAPVEGGGCRGAAHAVADASGALYQAFFGSPSEGLSPYTFVYEPGSFALADSIWTGEGPSALAIEVFE